MDQGGALTAGGIIAGIVTFRIPGAGLELPIAIHRPGRDPYYMSCTQCADTQWLGKGQPCRGCRPRADEPPVSPLD